MSDQTMKCKDCVLKHLAAAISYAKEILDGHGKGGTPDHRPDYLGELVNAEHHLEVMSRDLMEKVSVMRTAAQMKGMTPSEEDIESLRELWVDVEGLESELTPSFPEEDSTERYPGLSDMENVGVVLDDAWYDEDHEGLDMFMTLRIKKMTHAILMSREDIPGYEGKYLWVFPLNVYAANKVDMRQPVNVGVSPGRKPSFVPRLVRTDFMKSALANDPGASLCELVDRMTFEGVLKEDVIMPVVDRKPCCTLKTRLRTAPFVRVEGDGWPYMKKLWEGMA